LDGFFDEFLPGVFGGIPMLAADIIGTVTKPLGLDPVVKPILSALIGIYGFAVTAIPAPLKVSCICF